MARAKPDSESDAVTYAPGTKIIARAKGFPAWPAVVVAEEDVPEDVMALKPAKKTTFPVLFFNDSSFLWIAPEETQILTQEYALKHSQGKIKRTLKDAYALAANSADDYAELLASMLPKTASATEAESGDASPEEEEAPATSRARQAASTSRRARSAADRAAEQGSKTRALRPRRRATESPAPVVPSSKKQKIHDAAEDDDESEYVDQSETTESYDEQELQSSQGARLELCNSAREAIQEFLFVDKVGSTEPVETLLARIEETPELELAVVRRSKLQRAIFAALMHPLPGDLTKRLTALNERWQTEPEPVIKGIPEHLAPREPSEPPESRDMTPRLESELSANGDSNGISSREATEEVKPEVKPEEAKIETSQDAQPLEDPKPTVEPANVTVQSG